MKNRVKELVKQSGMTLEDFATSLGYSRQNLTKTLSNNPTIGTLEKIAGALGVEVADLFRPKNDFIAFVRMNGQTHTFTTPGDLKAFADTITDLQLCCNELEPQHDSNDVTQMYQDKAQYAKPEDSETQGE